MGGKTVKPLRRAATLICPISESRGITVKEQGQQHSERRLRELWECIPGSGQPLEREQA